MDTLVELLNAPDSAERLQALNEIAAEFISGKRAVPVTGRDVNNHIHTTYSFSPYSPSKAVYMAYISGLQTCGIIDHDSISGAEEFIEAGRIIGMATTIGIELRTSMLGSPFAARRLNNPDQEGNLYTTIHGIPHTKINDVKEFLKPINEARGMRNRAMTENINALFEPYDVFLDYDKDVLPISMAHEGGSVTERHLMYALAAKLAEKFGRGEKLIAFLTDSLELNVSKKVQEYLLDVDAPEYLYDLLGLLKAEFIPKIYIPATDECVEVREAVNFAHRIGGIICMPYLGDVKESVTGDKRAQTFEDSYLGELVSYCASIGFTGVAYMPSRNTKAQLDRLRGLCAANKLIQISGEDINQPRQKFICEAARAPEFSCLYDSTWALIGHELAATRNLEDAFISTRTVQKYPELNERILVYKQLGLELAGE